MNFYIPENVLELMESLYTPLVELSSVGADIVSRAELASITATYDSLIDCAGFGQPVTGFTLWSAYNLCEYMLNIYRALYEYEAWPLVEDGTGFINSATYVLDCFALELEPVSAKV